jgi:hypothetical protein
MGYSYIPSSEIMAVYALAGVNLEGTDRRSTFQRLYRYGPIVRAGILASGGDLTRAHFYAQLIGDIGAKKYFSQFDFEEAFYLSRNIDVRLYLSWLNGVRNFDDQNDHEIKFSVQYHF